MKKKIFAILVVGIFVLSGFGAVAITSERTYSNKLVQKSETVALEFSKPAIEEHNKEYFVPTVFRKIICSVSDVESVIKLTDIN